MSEQPATCAICGEPMPRFPSEVDQLRQRLAALEAGLREALRGWTDDCGTMNPHNPAHYDAHVLVRTRLRALLQAAFGVAPGTDPIAVMREAIRAASSAATAARPNAAVCAYNANALAPTECPSCGARICPEIGEELLRLTTELLTERLLGFEEVNTLSKRIAALEAGLREVLDGFPTRDTYPGVTYPGAWKMTGRLPLARVNALRASLLPPEAKGER